MTDSQALLLIQPGPITHTARPYYSYRRRDGGVGGREHDSYWQPPHLPTYLACLYTYLPTYLPTYLACLHFDGEDAVGT